MEETRAPATTAQTTTVAQTSETTATAAAPTPEPEATGLAALAGHWAGKWGGGSLSTLTITTDPDAVEYCYRDRCWDIDEYTFQDATLAWENRGWRFSFTLKGDHIRGKLQNPRGTTRITMKPGS